MEKCEWKDGNFIPCCDNIIYEIDCKFTIMMEGQVVVGTPNYCPHCGADIRKPVTIKTGMFGKFWTNGSSYYQYGELAMITYEGYSPKGSGTIFSNFTPGLPEGFNQDGSKK